ncbi:MAG: hypothetical protein IPL59_11010 [Candidatus Competibacteraceae bacterium]|nr:hypothetical protein [Candidatus Competibacteraceae bacterium]
MGNHGDTLKVALKVDIVFLSAALDTLDFNNQPFFSEIHSSQRGAETTPMMKLERPVNPVKRP